MYDHIFDPKSYNMCQGYFRNGNAVDAGAHHGTWTTRLSSKFRNVYAFEPQKKNYRFLQKATKDISNIATYEIALSDKIKKVAMSEQAQNSGQYFVKAGQEMTAYPLDHYNFQNVSFLKIDVEGYEWFVLNGAEQTIKSSWPVICLELNGLGKRYKSQDCNIIALLYSWGYYLETLQNKDYLFVKR